MNHPISYQDRVMAFMRATFPAGDGTDIGTRSFRFLEEAVELFQATGCTAHQAHQLVDYVFGRPVGEPSQEVGGTMVTLAALCSATGVDMTAAAEAELARVNRPEIMERIRRKQATKPKHSPLPQ